MTSQWQLYWSRSDNFIRIDLVKIDNAHSQTVAPRRLSLRDCLHCMHRDFTYYFSEINILALCLMEYLLCSRLCQYIKFEPSSNTNYEILG